MPVRAGEGIARSPGEQCHQLARVRQRFQSPDCRQRGIHTCIRDRPQRIARAVAELALELDIGERLFRRAGRIAGLDGDRASVGPLHRDAERAFRPALPGNAGDPIRYRQNRDVTQTVYLGYPDLAMHQGRGDKKGLRELRLHDLCRAVLCRPAAELVLVAGGIGLDGDRSNVVGPRDFKTRTCRQCRIDRGMQRPAAGVWLVAQRLTAESRTQVADQHRGIVPVGLIQLKEPETAIENVARPGEPGLRQDGRENAGACRLARLHPLGQRPVENALAIAGGVAVGDAEGRQHLLRCQADQLACCRGGAEHAYCRGAMPAAVERARQSDAARDIQPKRYRQQQIPPRDTVQAIANRQYGGQNRDAGMD